MTPQPTAENPLSTPGTRECLVHLVGGKQLREQLPEVASELATAENDTVMALVDEWEDRENE